MTDKPPGFFEGTEMPTAGWWEALWPDPAGVLAAVGIRPGMDVIDLCSGDGWFTLQIAKIARRVVDANFEHARTAWARRRSDPIGSHVTIYLYQSGSELRLSYRLRQGAQAREALASFRHPLGYRFDPRTSDLDGAAARVVLRAAS